jgi:hypothetical protein
MEKVRNLVEFCSKEIEFFLFNAGKRSGIDPQLEMAWGIWG